MKVADEWIFEEIRKYTKYCSMCGGKMNIRSGWHYPFCTGCRMKLLEEGKLKRIS